MLHNLRCYIYARTLNPVVLSELGTRSRGFLYYDKLTYSAVCDLDVFLPD